MKLVVSDEATQVKVEVNIVFRGTVLPVESRPLVPSAQELFTTDLAVPVLATAELYGSKLVAAMDRQHPRDIFDVMHMLDHFGWQAGVVDCFVAYLAGHNRPVHEVLFPKAKPLEPAFTNEFSGMTRNVIELDTLAHVQARLLEELPRQLIGGSSRVPAHDGPGQSGLGPNADEASPRAAGAQVEADEPRSTQEAQCRQVRGAAPTTRGAIRRDEPLVRHLRSFGSPVVNVASPPAHGTHRQLDRRRELPGRQQSVDRRSTQSGQEHHLRQAEDGGSDGFCGEMHLLHAASLGDVALDNLVAHDTP